MPFYSTNYSLKCLACGKEYQEDRHLLTCNQPHGPAFLRTVYEKKQLTIRKDAQGMFRFGDWLPLRKPVKNIGYPIAYKSEALAKHLGLENLWISFCGYWPERQANMLICTFKELEAPPVLSRLANDERTLVVASAGNTARAFAELCSANNIPLLLVVPEKGLKSLWSTKPFSNLVRLITVTGDADYSDAIKLAGLIAALPLYLPEGGAKNVARRDGMGVSVLAAVTEIGRIPDHYFQAVGSGTGGIAAWEAAQRLETDGRFGENHMKLHLVQNHPFAPMTEAWEQKSRTIPEIAEDEARKRTAEINAHVLSNRRPPYSPTGGVFDALQHTHGLMYAVTNEDAERAGKIFETLEGIDLSPAAKVAVAGLVSACSKAALRADDVVLLNVTGGGQRRLFAEHDIYYLQPQIEVRREDICENTVDELFA